MDCHPVDDLLVNEVMVTTMGGPDRPLMAARRVEERAVIRPSDSSGWPEGAKEIRGEPEFRSYSSDDTISFRLKPTTMLDPSTVSWNKLIFTPQKCSVSCAM